MALIPCAECGKQISEMASSCPSCGHPANASGPAVERPIQTIEQTSKSYKLGQMAGVAMICASVVACVGGKSDASAALAFFGLIVWLGARMGAWWKNG